MVYYKKALHTDKHTDRQSDIQTNIEIGRVTYIQIGTPSSFA